MATLFVESIKGKEGDEMNKERRPCTQASGVRSRLSGRKGHPARQADKLTSLAPLCRSIHDA